MITKEVSVQNLGTRLFLGSNLQTRMCILQTKKLFYFENFNQIGILSDDILWSLEFNDGPQYSVC